MLLRKSVGQHINYFGKKQKWIVSNVLFCNYDYYIKDKKKVSCIMLVDENRIAVIEANIEINTLKFMIISWKLKLSHGSYTIFFV